MHYIDQKDVSNFLDMIDDRNLATHTYYEALADEIFGQYESLS